MNLGNNIKKLRRFKRITSTNLAQTVGISQAYLSEIENNKKTPTIEVLQKIANILNVTVSDLLDETDNKFTVEQYTLMNTTKDLNPEQITALIVVAKAFGKNNSSNDNDEKTTYKVITRAAHYEGNKGLDEDEQSILERELQKTKDEYNPDGSKKK